MKQSSYNSNFKPAFYNFQCEVCGKIFTGTRYQAKKQGWYFGGTFNTPDGDTISGEICGDCAKTEWNEKNPLNYDYSRSTRTR